MSHRIRITWPGGEAIARLDDTPTSRALLAALPITARASTWGEEVYFRTPVHVPLEPDARQVVEPGTVCFWVDGDSLALPFGPTPISRGSECRLASRCNILGRLETPARELALVRDGESIKVLPLGAPR